MGWMKGNTNADSRIAFFHREMTDNKPLYLNDYCQGIKKCKTSKRGTLDIKTGTLMIHEVNLDDEDLYYYWFWVDESVPDTGMKYEIDLQVYGKLNDLRKL